MNALKENLKKYFRGSHELLQVHEKVCDGNESRNKKKPWAPKIFCWEEGVHEAHVEISCNGYQATSGERFLVPRGWFLNMGARMGTIKLAMAGT